MSPCAYSPYENKLIEFERGTFLSHGRKPEESVVSQYICLSQIFKLIVSISLKMFNNVNVILKKQVKKDNISLLVAVRDSKTPLP